jgi:hypothetical protein
MSNEIEFNSAAFFNVVRESIFGGQMSQDQVDGVTRIGAACSRAGLVPLVEQAAYVLATVYHETAATMRPIEEYGGSSTRYAPWYGRGDVQLTWEDNYKKQQNKLKTHPARDESIPYQVHDDWNLALNPETSALICVLGMQDGDFTGKGLNDYITTSHVDYWNARRIVNGTDKADLIKSHAQKFEAALMEGLGGVRPPVPEIPTYPLEVQRATVSKDQNDRHPSVGSAQWLLNSHGFDSGDVDGVAGGMFDNAMCEFQADRGLVVDGVCGPVSWEALEGVKS